MRSVSNTMLKRFAVAAQEAEFLGKPSLAGALTRQIEKNADNVRSDNEPYRYSQAELRADLQESIWDAVVRLADFHQVQLKEGAVEALVNDVCSDIDDTFCRQHECFKGAYEQDVPGEHFEVIEEEESNG